MRRSAFLLVPLALALAACGGTTNTPRSAAADEPAVLQLLREDEQSDVIYIEGWLWKVGVHGADGSSPLDRVVHDYSRKTVDVQLTPGATYTVESAVQPCDANCGYLDRPVDGCTTDLQLDPGEHRTLVVHVKTGHPCRFT